MRRGRTASYCLEAAGVTARTPALAVGADATGARVVAALTAGAVLAAFLLHPWQLLAGSVVNFALFAVAMRARRAAWTLPVILLPSMALVAAAALTGSPLAGVLALLPVIWVANGALVALVRIFGRGGASSGEGAGPTPLLVVSAAAGKTLVITAGAIALAAAGLVPAVVVGVVAPLQLATAVIGGAAAWAFARERGTS